jgi:hypothetical protein
MEIKKLIKVAKVATNVVVNLTVAAVLYENGYKYARKGFEPIGAAIDAAVEKVTK